MPTVATVLSVATFVISERVARLIPEPIKTLFGCLFCFDNNISTPEDVGRELERERNSLQMRVDVEVNNAQIVDPKVEYWFEDTNANQRKLTEILDEIRADENVGLISTSRFSYTKKVKERTKAVQKLLQSCKFDILVHPPPPEASVPAPQESTCEFESRKSIEEGIMRSLRDNGVYKVGICGMGGVGKTTMAKRIRHIMRDNRLFEEIVMVVVRQNADKVRIQDDIAKSLDLKFRETSSKAYQLRTRLSGSKKRCLVILDDVWEVLNLVDLGIPHSSHCKVLLTSRDTDVFKKMDVEVHGVNLLTDAEAWDFFQLNAANCASHPNVISVAQQVVKECKGLPVALKAVAAALKDIERTSIWEDSLQQLRSANPSDMPDVLKEVYRPLRWSYDALPSERERFLFLMCCLYPEDYNIPIKELAINAIGLGRFDGIKRLKHKRNRVYSLVETLKSRSLLLEGYDVDHVKMHDVVRDVAIFIASGEKWIATHSESNDCTWISPYIRETIGLHEGSADYPNLRLLWIDGYSRDKELEIHDHIFKGMKELHVLSITSSLMRQLSISMMLLKNLRTLGLVFCNSLESITVVGELVNLEILICRNCGSIESLPVEIGRLSGLKLLELSNCYKLKKIPPGIISRLKELEELIVWRCFDGWEAKNMGKESENALLSELEHLSSLSRLEIEVKDSRLAAEQIRLSPNLMQYHIRIGDPEIMDRRIRYIYERKLELILLENISLGEWIHELVKSVEHMHVEGDGSGRLDFGVAHNMRLLIFKDCSTVKTLMSVKNVDTDFARLETLRLVNLVALKEICDIDGPMSSNSFNNLQKLKLKGLPGLEHLNILSNFNMLSSLDVYFCNKLSAVMRRGSSIVQLKSLRISYCKMMEQVLLWDEEEDQIVFQNLKKLKLVTLPNVSSFSKGIKRIGFPVLEEMQVDGCKLMKSFVCNTSPHDDDDGDWIRILFESQKFDLDSLRKLEVGGCSGSMCRNWCPMITAIFSRLSELAVGRIDSMKSLFPYSVAQNLHNLRELRIWFCNDMVVVIEDDACGGQTPPTPTPLLPNLKQIRLRSLPKLKSFCECKHTLEFPSLTRLYIYDCDSMEEFTSGHVSTPILPHIATGYEEGGIINISNGVNAALKQEWLERQQEELNSRSKHPIVKMVMEPEQEEEIMSFDDDGGQTEEEEEEDISSDDDEDQTKEEGEEEVMSSDDQIEKEQNVEDSKRVEQSRKRGLSIGLENEFQSQKWRRIETEI